jgi:translation elongation factor aEF-1 beta
MKMKQAVIETVKKVAPAAQLQGFETKPFAYGLNLLYVTILTNDMSGGVDPLEEALGQIEGVGSAQVENMGRI